MVGIELEYVAKDRASAIAREREIAVVGEIDDRGSVRDCGVVDPEGAARHRIPHRHVESARVSLLAVRAAVAEQHRGLVALLDGPDLPVKAFVAAVHTVRRRVLREHDLAPVDSKPASRDPVREAADDGAKVRAGHLVAREVGAAKHNVPRSAATIGRDHRSHDAAEGQDVDAQRGIGAEGHAVDFAPVTQATVRGDAHRGAVIL